MAIDGPQPTNIHYHGMDVSPIPPGDSVFIRIKPKKDFRYGVYIPNDHPQGLHWYHAHVHHFVEDQIGSGVSGMLIVDGFIELQYPELVGPAPAGDGLQGFHLPGLQGRRGAGQVAQRLRQPADPQPARASSRSGRSAISAPTRSST